MILRETFDEAMQWLKKYHGRDLEPATVELYFEGLRDSDEKDFIEAVGQWCSKSKPTPEDFPTIGDLRIAQRPTVRNSRSEYVKRSLQIVNDFYDKKLTRDEYLAAMEEMENEKPGLGWKLAAQELRAQWARDAESAAAWEKRNRQPQEDAAVEEN